MYLSRIKKSSVYLSMDCNYLLGRVGMLEHLCVSLQENPMTLNYYFSQGLAVFSLIFREKYVLEFFLWRGKGKGKGFTLLLKISFERYWKINLSLASQKCMCSPLVAEHNSRQKRFRIENVLGVERRSCKFPWLILSFKVYLDTTTDLSFPFPFSII